MFFIDAVFSDMCNYMWSYRISKLLVAAEGAFTEDTQKLSFFYVFCMHLSYQKDKKQMVSKNILNVLCPADCIMHYVTQVIGLFLLLHVLHDVTVMQSWETRYLL